LSEALIEIDVDRRHCAEMLGMEGPSRLQVKTAHIESLLQRFPRRKFICVGDTSEQDPEVRHIR
jgi:phosphatidate phosphatase APP1